MLINLIIKIKYVFISTKGNTLWILGYKEGSLCVRYVGVPLITIKLRYVDCFPLTERITKRVKNWTNKALSYADRL